MKVVRLFAFSALFFLSCLSTHEVEPVQPLTLLVTGNTAPDSAFGGLSARIHGLVTALHHENSHAVIHTGNVIRGGFSWEGVRADDIARQISLWERARRQLSVPVYIARGPLDHHDGSDSVMETLTGFGSRYAVTLGKTVLVFLDSSGLSASSSQWLERELAGYGNHDIILVSHAALPGTPLAQDGQSRFTEIIASHPVRLVISGEQGRYRRVDRHGVVYLQLPCGGFSESEKYRRIHSYHRVQITGDTVTVTHHYVRRSH